MTVAGAAASALDRSIGWDWIRTGIAFARILKCDRDLGLCAGYSDEWNPNRRAQPKTRPKIGMAWTGRSDGVYVRGRHRMHRQRVDARVPDIIGWEHRTAPQCLRVGRVDHCATQQRQGSPSHPNDQLRVPAPETTSVRR